MCSRVVFANIQQPIAWCFRPIASVVLIHMPPLPPSSGLLGPFYSGCAQWLHRVLATRRDMVSPLRTLSQTWPLSPPDLMLKWACKEYVLEQEEKITVLKNPKGDHHHHPPSKGSQFFCFLPSNHRKSKCPSLSTTVSGGKFVCEINIPGSLHWGSEDVFDFFSPIVFVVISQSSSCGSTFQLGGRDDSDSAYFP